MTNVSQRAVGKVTRPTFFICDGEKPSPIANMRKTTPSWPIVWTDDSSERNETPQVWREIRTPARM